MEEITERLTSNLVIEDAEEDAVIRIDNPEEMASGRFWLCGRVLSNNQYNFEAMRRVLQKIWKLKEEFVISRWENTDRILFSFGTAYDRDRVLNGSPWSFDKMLILLAIYDGLSNPATIPLEKQAFWVRVRKLKPDNINPKMAGRLGPFIGEYVPSHEEEWEDAHGKCLRIRVELSISTPIKRWLYLESEKLPLEYEHLPYFCLYCGCMDHLSPECKLHKNGLIPEKRFRRWGTIDRDTFSIDPDGGVGGKSKQVEVECKRGDEKLVEEAIRKQMLRAPSFFLWVASHAALANLQSFQPRLFTSHHGY